VAGSGARDDRESCDAPDAGAARAALLAEVAALPSLPGVYRYFDAAGQRCCTWARRAT
jgi:hypothetical protein